MTQDELDRLEALANAATPGPWYYWGDGDWFGFGADAQAPEPLGRVHGDMMADAAFIAAARDAVPALTKAVRERDAEIARLRGLVEAAYLEGSRDRLPEGDAELADIQWARSDAREALEGA